MTDNDEETKEHPVYPDAPPPAQPVAAGPVTGDLDAASLPAAPMTVTPMTVDPLEPTTTITAAPPMPPGAVPLAPTYPPPPAQPPNQGWPGQPPSAANLPSQYQASGYGQPGFGQPAYGQPGYGAPPGYAPAQQWGAARATYGTSVFVALAAMLLVIFGVVIAVLGAWLLTQGPALNDLIQRLRSVDLIVFKPTREELRQAFSALPGVLMVFGVLHLLVGAFVLAHRGWARWLGVLIALIGLPVSVLALTSTLALVPGASVQLIVSIALLIGYAFIFLALIAGGGHFRARYQGR
ncbi:MAG TPA: hypothetical protein VM284_02710 [Candidatus Limnocylindria bacterium]|nr:hypothetical protein [Candidatus Limnocylindria bacterium]